MNERVPVDKLVELDREQIVTIAQKLALPVVSSKTEGPSKRPQVAFRFNGLPYRGGEQPGLYKTAKMIATHLNRSDVRVVFDVDSPIAKLATIQASPEQVGVKQQQDVEEGDSFHLILMAGGQGSRLRPLTLKIPKQLLPIRGIPMMTKTLRLLAGEQVSRVSVVISTDSSRPSTFKDAFFNWWRANPDVVLADQDMSRTYMHNVLELMFTQDPRYVMVVHGDKILNFDQAGIQDLFLRIQDALNDCSFVLVGKKADGAIRKVQLKNGNKIERMLSASDVDDGQNALGFGSAFIVLDTERLPLVFGNELKSIENFTLLFKLLLESGLKGKIVELPSDFSWKNVNTIEDYAAELEFISQTTDVNQIPTPDEILAAHSVVQTPGCIFPPIKQLRSGLSNADLEIVTDQTGVPMVRKSWHGHLPTDELGLAERPNALLHRSMFLKEDSSLLVQPDICSRCEGIVCSVGPYIEGKMLDEFIQTDPRTAHVIRMRILEILEKRKYFEQRHMLPGNKIWEQWLTNRNDLLEQLTTYSRKRDERRLFFDLDLPEIAADAIAKLTDPSVLVPHGFFFRDLNPGNIIITKENHIRVIDQHLWFGDPVILPIKLIIGWRKLSAVLKSDNERDGIVSFLAEEELISELDTMMLQWTFSRYPSYRQFEPRFYAALLLRHIRGITHLRNHHFNHHLLGEVEQMLYPYVTKAIRMSGIE